MAKGQLPILPKNLAKNLGKAYSGLFGNSACAKVLEEMVASFQRHQTLKELQEMTDMPAKEVYEVVCGFIDSKLVLVDKSKKEPRYYINPQSKRLIALTFLAYAVIDDRDGGNCMDMAIQDYVRRQAE